MMALRARSEALCNAHGRLDLEALEHIESGEEFATLGEHVSVSAAAKMVGTVFAELEWDKDKTFI